MPVVRGKQSGRDKAYHYLRDVILSDPANAGTFVEEQLVAQAVGVSRTPVREALLLLVADGMVEMHPKKGAYIPPVTSREVSELIDLRSLLERHAVVQTMATGSVPVSAMRAALNRQRELLRPETTETAREFIQWDATFHQSLIDAVGNDLLSRTYAGLRVRQVRNGVDALFRSAGRRSAVCDEHSAILAALQSDDAGAAHRAITEHLSLTQAILLGR
jgi:DNA-binding GntR family transcriptional regulator